MAAVKKDSIDGYPTYTATGRTYLGNSQVLGR